MTAETPALSDSEDDYLIIDNGPVDLPLLNSAIDSESQPENEVNDGCAKSLEKSTTTDPDDDGPEDELEKRKMRMFARWREKENVENKLVVLFIMGALVTCCVGMFIGLFAHGRNATRRRALEDNVKKLEQSVERLKNEVKWRDETIAGFNDRFDGMQEHHRARTAALTAENDRLTKIINKMSCETYATDLAVYKENHLGLHKIIQHLHRNIDALLRGQWNYLFEEHQAKTAAVAAENDRLRKIVNEKTGDTGLQQSFRDVALYSWMFSVRNVFIDSVTRGDGIRCGDQIVSINGLPLMTNLSSKELIKIMDESDAWPVRLVVRQNIEGKKMVEQLHTQLVKYHIDWAETKQTQRGFEYLVGKKKVYC